MEHLETIGSRFSEARSEKREARSEKREASTLVLFPRCSLDDQIEDDEINNE
jgi:hypothetical protein